MTNLHIVAGDTAIDTLRADILDVVNRLVDQLEELHQKNAEQDAEIRALRLATDPTLYTAKQVEQVLGITAPTRRELTARGELPVVHLDSRPRYRKVDVEALIAEKAA